MSKLKIGIIEPVGGHGGMNYYDYGLALGLSMNDIDVTLYTCDKTKIEYQNEVKTQLSYKGIWGKTNKLIRLVRYLKSSRRSFKHAKNNGVTILHFHFFDVRILEKFDIKTSHRMGFKNVVTIHDIESLDSRSGRTSQLQSLDDKIEKYIVHNRTTQNRLEQSYPFTVGKTHLIAHGNYLESIKNVKTYSKLDDIKLTENDFSLLFFGQIKEVKGLDILLEAIKKCSKDIPNIKLIIAGKTWQDDFAKYKNIIDALDIDQKVVQHIRYISDQELGSYYNRADLVVLPYKRIYQSGVLLMAMSFGKPVLTSNLDAMLDTIKDGHNGFTFESEDPNHLAERITFIQQNPELAKKVSVQALEDMKSNYSWSTIGKQTAKLYAEL